MVGGALDCNTSPDPSWRLRLCVSRGAAISCIPPPLPASPLSATPFPPTCPFPRPSTSSYTASSSSSTTMVAAVEDKKRWGEGKSGGAELEGAGVPGTGDSGARCRKNCIRSSHIREPHRVLRNQLNEESLLVAVEEGGGTAAEGTGGEPAKGRRRRIDERAEEGRQKK